jgi:hypothetical protein
MTIFCIAFYESYFSKAMPKDFLFSLATWIVNTDENEGSRKGIRIADELYQILNSNFDILNGVQSST